MLWSLITATRGWLKTMRWVFLLWMWKVQNWTVCSDVTVLCHAAPHRARPRWSTYSRAAFYSLNSFKYLQWIPLVYLTLKLFYFLHVWMLFRKIRTMWIIWSSQAHTTFALTTGSPNISVCQGEPIKNVVQKQGTKIKKKGSTLRELHFDFIQYVKSRFWHLNFLNMSETSRWIPSTVLVKRTAVTLEVSMLTKSTTSFQRFSHAYAIILQRSHHCPIRNGKIQKK